MSEAVETPVTPTILPAKSEDKLEIEKEEIEKEEEKKEETKEEGDVDTKVESEEVKDDKEKTEESTEKKDEGEKTEDEPEEGDSKKFKLPKIKTPKVIKELRSKSKERKKKKEEEKQNEEEKPDEDKDAKKEDEGDEKKEEDKAAEGEEKKEGEEVKQDEEKKEDEKEDEEKKDETKDTKTKIKDAIDNIHMPKFHKPSFMKKKEEPEDKAEEKIEDESKEEGEKEEKTEEKGEKTEEKEEKGETEESKETEEAKPEGTKDTKTKVKEALDNIHMPKMPKLHKPNFMKKKSEEAGTSEETEKSAEEPEKETEKGDTEKADNEETKEEDKESSAKEGEENDEKTDEEQTKPDKKSLMDKMTSKLSKPAFLKKKKDSEEETEVKETDDAKPEDEKNEKEETQEKEEKDEKGDEKNEEEKVDEKEKSDDKEEETKKSEEKEEETKKSSILDSLRSIKAPKLFSNKKEKITDEETADESKELLEKKEDEEETVEDGKDLVTVENEKTATPSKASTLLQNIRSVASGVPALFKKDKVKEVDVEAGESQELLEKKDSTDAPDSNKINEEDLVEIKLDDGTEKKDPDSKSQGSEKKDPEKSDGEKDTLCRVKNAPSEACTWFQGLDQQKKYGICGIILGIILLFLIIIIAVAATPGNWYNSNRMVEGGKYIETITSCGTIQGLVDGEDRYSFTGIPYSVPMTEEYRFTHSRLPATLAECPNGTFLAHAVNTTKPPGSCWRSLPGGITGDEDCLTLDVFTSNVVYNEQLPVVVYVSGEGLDIEEEQKLRPTSALAQQKMTVFVTVSIRTGVLGFLSHPALARDEYHSSSGNYGLGDLVTALKWINVNIHHFGGHPGKVTVMGHQFGATVVTALTGTPAAEGLFSKIWVTSGAGKFSNRTAEEVQADNDKILENLNCGEDKLKCLMEADPKELVKAVPEVWNTASKLGLPSDSEEPQHSWIAKDNFLYTGTPFSGETNSGLPIVIGAPAQTDATSDGYMYMPNWNETDKYESMVESSLASFGDNLFPRTAMDQYNMSNNWKEYTSMVSDIRTICPLELLAQQAAKSNSDSVFFYVAETPRSASQLGGVADASSDIAAIFGLFDPQNFHEEKFMENMQSMFNSFVKRGKLPGNTLVGEGIYQVCHKIEYTKEYKTCKFWKDTEWNIVPGFAKI